MNRSLLLCVVGMVLLGGCGSGDNGVTSANNNAMDSASPPHYTGANFNEVAQVHAALGGINDRGQIALSKPDAMPGQHAFLYDNGTLTDLGALGGSLSAAFGINNNGQVVGGAQTPAQTAFGVYDAFLWDSSHGMQDLGTLPGGRSSVAYAINTGGQVVGSSDTGSGHTHAVLWQNGQVIDLGTLQGDTDSTAWAINSSGQVVGVSYVPLLNTGEPPDVSASSQAHAFLWEAGQMKSLAPVGSSHSSAASINDLGQVVGSASVGNDQVEHAFLWTDRNAVDLYAASNGLPRTLNSGGSYSSGASSINNRGDVVGTIELNNSVSDQLNASGFLYRQGTMYRLSDLVEANRGFSPNTPRAINNRGAIVGTAFDCCGGPGNSFLLTPQ